MSGRRFTGPALALAMTMGGVGQAHADEPRRFVRVQPEGALNRRLTLEAYTSLSFVEFDRPDRACSPDGPALGFCPDISSELAVGFGGSVGVRFWGPLSASWGIAFARTEPELGGLSPQTMILMPFSVVATWPAWDVRPIGELSVVGFGLLPDGVRSVMLTARGGVAFRVGTIDLGLSAGFGTSDAMKPIEVRLSVMHLR